MPEVPRGIYRDRRLPIYIGAGFFLASLEALAGVWTGNISLLAHAAYGGGKLIFPALNVLAGSRSGPGMALYITGMIYPRLAAASFSILFFLGTALLWSAPASLPEPDLVRPDWAGAAVIMPLIIASAVVCRVTAVGAARRKSLLYAVVAGHYQAGLLLLGAVQAATVAAAVGCGWPGFLVTAGIGLLILLEAVWTARYAVNPAQPVLPPGAAEARAVPLAPGRAGPVELQIGPVKLKEEGDC